jgi:hypothetical protein
MTDCDCTYTAADIDTLVNDLQVSWAEVAELKRKLAKAVQALDRIAGKAPYADDPYDIARAALAELTGNKP